MPLKDENGFGGEGEQDFEALESATKPFDDAYTGRQRRLPRGNGGAMGMLDYVRRNRDKLVQGKA